MVLLEHSMYYNNTDPITSRVKASKSYKIKTKKRHFGSKNELKR